MKIESNLNGVIIVRQAPAGAKLTWNEVSPFKDEYEIEYSFNIFRALRKRDNGILISYGDEEQGVIELYLPIREGVENISLSGQARVVLDLDKSIPIIEVNSSGQGSVIIKNQVTGVYGNLSGQSSIFFPNATDCQISISGQSSLTAVRASSIKARVSGQSQISVVEEAGHVSLSLSGQSRAVLSGNIDYISGEIIGGSQLIILGKVRKMGDLYTQSGSVTTIKN
ncbi:hypothetical protein [Bacillus sp. FSL K6-6540]|uniref:hypothetical protein n=1 Tax=Bacillus sp. FSL K6-6540 TaxID=2921512 RepID=UPI0030FC3D3B